MIGLFDSGLGGLTVLRRIRESTPHHDVLYFADQAHVPYGGRDPEELVRLLAGNIAFLNANGAHLIVAACNTSCAIAAERGWPASAAPIVNLIESTAEHLARAGFSRVAVIATEATVASKAYPAAILKRMPEARVQQIAAPELVPLIEAGHTADTLAREAVKRVCATLRADVRAVVLGCTHYPLVEPLFAEEIGAAMQIVDPAVEQARRARVLLGNGAVSEESGVVRYVTSGEPAAFRTAVMALTGELAPLVESAGPAGVYAGSHVRT